jgi:hypothetical protein
MTKILELLKFLPALIAAVMALVKVFEVPGNGENKKSAVLIVVGLIFDTLGTLGIELPIVKEKVLEFIGKAIDAIVAFLNAVKTFNHGETVNPSLPKVG